MRAKRKSKGWEVFMKPGVHVIKNSAYHSGPGLSSSGVKELLKSALHFHTYKNTPNEPTPEMLRGTLVHTLILEPDKIHEDFVVGDFKIRRGKEYDNLVLNNPDKIVITREEFDEANLCAQSFWKQQADNSELNKLTTGGHRELSFYWEDKATGVLCKARPDLITDCGTTIVDIKTARDGSFDAFQKAIVDYKYFISAPYYLRGVNEVMSDPKLGPKGSVLWNVKPTRFVFVVIETKAPYAVSIYELDENALAFGSQLIDRALDSYAESVATDLWTGYSKSVIPISLPNWAMYRFNHAVGGAK
jgi:hypothetical protein